MRPNSCKYQRTNRDNKCSILNYVHCCHNVNTIHKLNPLLERKKHNSNNYLLILKCFRLITACKARRKISNIISSTYSKIKWRWASTMRIARSCQVSQLPCSVKKEIECNYNDIVYLWMYTSRYQWDP